MPGGSTGGSAASRRAPERPAAAAFRAPRTAAEEALCGLFAEVLGLDEPLLVPPLHAHLGALGAALSVRPA